VATPIVLVVDMANVVGSIPDGWWRDRAGAAERLLSGLAALAGHTVPGPDGASIQMGRIVAVLEGSANRAGDDHSNRTEALEIFRAAGSGDDAIVDLVVDLIAAGDHLLVVSADRGLRARLPEVATTTGPRWLNVRLGRR